MKNKTGLIVALFSLILTAQGLSARADTNSADYKAGYNDGLAACSSTDAPPMLLCTTPQISCNGHCDAGIWAAGSWVAKQKTDVIEQLRSDYISDLEAAGAKLTCAPINI